jgi:hypothetical protein
VPLALLDTQQHALGVDIRHLQRNDLGNPQARPIGGTECGLVLRPRCRLQKGCHLLGALKTTGIFRGSATNVRGLVTSARSTVMEKKNRSAETAPLMVGARTPVSVRCSW